MIELSKALRTIGASEAGKSLIVELKTIRDMPLAVNEANQTFHRIGQRDLAMDLLEGLEPKTEEEQEDE